MREESYAGCGRRPTYLAKWARSLAPATAGDRGARLRRTRRLRDDLPLPAGSPTPLARPAHTSLRLGSRERLDEGVRVRCSGWYHGGDALRGGARPRGCGRLAPVRPAARCVRIARRRVGDGRRRGGLLPVGHVCAREASLRLLSRRRRAQPVDVPARAARRRGARARAACASGMTLRVRSRSALAPLSSTGSGFFVGAVFVGLAV